MKTTIKNKAKWRECYGISGDTAQTWLRQILANERETEVNSIEVMKNLVIGGWSHCSHYKNLNGFNETENAYGALISEVERLAKELDMRLHQLTAVENTYRSMIRDQVL